MNTQQVENSHNEFNIITLSQKVIEIETMLTKLADVSKQLLEVNLKMVGKSQITKEAYKVSEVASLTGMSKSVIRQKINDGEILKMASSTVGLILIPKSEVERLTLYKNSVTEKTKENDKILKAISENKIVGLSLSRNKIKKVQK